MALCYITRRGSLAAILHLNASNLMVTWHGFTGCEWHADLFSAAVCSGGEVCQTLPRTCDFGRRPRGLLGPCPLVRFPAAFSEPHRAFPSLNHVVTHFSKFLHSSYHSLRLHTSLTGPEALGTLLGCAVACRESCRTECLALVLLVVQSCSILFILFPVNIACKAIEKESWALHGHNTFTSLSLHPFVCVYCNVLAVILVIHVPTVVGLPTRDAQHETPCRSFYPAP
jgi:hypothetical protein